ncbi:site-specific DNA-methyltransferase [Leptospira ilyithenensis]|uniref:site-specific DNA-methyltransferase (adenine-specific) n=1 Tax=Leptospira ilyithenensis TaxID=2484901 RepID=A0A4R9LQ53_9LEPT|nr:site-specific DNA-methyltransferase [Leptospira ilyithenensis]TGN11571.1 site-specific DNA-methyltransferase [Leptospira ilyithenensis]
MANNKTKLELTWIGKENRPRLEPRILLQDTEKSYHSKHRITKSDIFDNRLIFGDNLLALKALEQEFTGKVKCIYIDPPYNTGSAFEHYDDGLEHSIWLGLMRDRLECLRGLLSQDGFIFIQIDYRESARLKLLLDEVFGSSCFRNEIIVGRGIKNIQSQFEDIDSLSSGHDTVYLYAKTNVTRLKTLFEKLDDPQPGKWDTFWRGTDRPTMRYKIFGITPEKGQWRWSKERAFLAKSIYEKYQQEFSNQMSLDEYWQLYERENGNEADFLRLGPDNTVQYYVGPRNYKMLSDVWLNLRSLGKITDFPHEKHEDLLYRIIEWTTKPGDLVLDSFAGSGTTGAVAHKMGRRWIMVELGEHCHTHIIPRLKKVIDGEDQGGISKVVDWQGGGGFRYYKLAPSLLEKDKWDNWVINKQYNATMLAEAICKLEGFIYSPSDSVYWIHGHSTETDYIYVTTQTFGRDQLAILSDEVGSERTLLVMCSAFQAKSSDFQNLTIKKIPNAVLSRCEWSHDDYSLQIENLPMAPKLENEQPGLFDLEETNG